MVKQVFGPKGRFGLKDGISTIELLVAMTVLSTAALGVFGILSNTETQLLESRNDFTAQQSEEALGTFVYDEFISYDPDIAASGLTASKSEQTYPNGQVPNADLRYRSLMGNEARYGATGVLAKCRLASATNESIGTVSFASDCVTVPEGASDNETIAEVMNDLLLAGIPISFGIENVGSLCSVSTPIASALTAAGQTAVMSVDNPDCLNSPVTGQPAADAELILPRFVVYSGVDANRFNTSLIERPTGKSVGMALTGPSAISVASGVSTADTNFLLSSLADDDTGLVSFTTTLAGVELSISNAAGATITGNNTNNLTLTGTIGQLKDAIRNFFYQSPDGYFGDDSVSVVARSGPLRSALSVPVDIAPNCGNQQNGTATRFDLGYVDNSTGVPFFDESTASFITTVSVFDDASPTHFYGYCKPGQYLYEYVDETRTNSCGSSTVVIDGITYQPNSPRLMQDPDNTSWAINRAINVFLYEESDNLTENRYALQVMLDAYPGTCNTGSTSNSLADSRSTGIAMRNEDFKALTEPDPFYPDSKVRTGSQSEKDDRRCHMGFRISNIEDNRNLDNQSDLHTFTDDPGEYTAVIGDDNSLVAAASWRDPIDGVVIPLRVAGSSPNSLFRRELRDYNSDLAFGNDDPIFELLFYDTLDAWNIRSLDPVTNTIVFRRFAFVEGNADQTQAIRLNISQSRRCGT